MNITRLRRLADFLDTLPVEKFNFNNFLSVRGLPPAQALAAGSNKCGTTACAIGWLPAIDPENWAWDDQLIWPDIWELNYKPDPHAGLFDAAAQYFEITTEESLHLFDPVDSHLGPSATPIDVADHIRTFISDCKV